MTTTTTATVEGLTAQLSLLGVDSNQSSPPQHYDGADILARPLDIFKTHLAGMLADTLGCDAQLAFASIAESAQSDLDVKLPKLRLAKEEQNEPQQVCGRLPLSNLFVLPYADGPLLRFMISKSALPRVILPYIQERKTTYGQYATKPPTDNPDSPAPSRVLVEFSSPNVGPEFNGTHLRSTLLGAYIANAHECMGWRVTRLNYLGDWGKELALLAVGFGRFGSEERLAAAEASPLAHMLDVYTQIKEQARPQQDEIRKAKDQGLSAAELESTGILGERDVFFKSLEDGDESAVKLWQRFRDLFIEHMAVAYARLGIKFDQYSGESQVKPQTMQDVVSVLKSEGVLTEIPDGSLAIDFEEHGGKTGKGLGTQVLTGRNGSTTYLLRDVAAALERDATGEFDKIIYVVSSRQSSHFQQLSITLRLMKREDVLEKIQHVGFGEVQDLPAKFQSPLLLSSIIDQCAEVVRQTPGSEEHASGGGAGGGGSSDVDVASGLVFQEMGSRKRGHSYAFDASTFLSSGGEDGGALNLVTLRRAVKVLLARIDDLGKQPDIHSASADYSAVESELSLDMIAFLARYPETTSASFKTLEPHTLLSYLTGLASSVIEMLLDEAGSDGGQDTKEEGDEGGEASGAAEEKGKEELERTPGGKRAEMELYCCAAQVLRNGMGLLGFPVEDIVISWA